MRTVDPTETPLRADREPDGPCMVLGYDRSESARHAASWATNELLSDGKLVIVYACRPLHAPPAPLSTASERHDLGRALLDELMLDGDEELLDIHFATEVSDENPVTALIDAARRHKARAIVIGTKHHSLLHRVLGTVTTELLKTSPVPVVTVPFGQSGSGPTLRSPAPQSRAPRARAPVSRGNT
jgi:nucleotide-binding universal stress UspA family protein